ncbi:DUF6332 family protein [Streptomyces sp. NPDC050504]|uniref:DUF6332 family protein n=1 Tax=Streptomyces sp. NPDC050504 TaxID=3365618 RepID=UPI0037A217B2
METLGAQGRRTRTRAERDAVTVEIVYALVSAAFVAGLAFGATAWPVLLLDLPPRADRMLLMAGCALAGAAFVVRTVLVLWRFGRRERSGAQPSQPGLTSPDS